MQEGLGLVLIPMLICVGLLLFRTATINLRRMWAFPSVLLLGIVMIFSANLSIQQINNSYIYQYVWSWPINNDFSLEFGLCILCVFVFVCYMFLSFVFLCSSMFSFCCSCVCCILCVFCTYNYCALNKYFLSSIKKKKKKTQP